MFRYATAQDAIDIPNANEGDLLITGGNTTSGGLPAVWITANSSFAIGECKKVLIKGGVYDYINFDNPASGTSSCQIIITNYDGQVEVRNGFRLYGLNRFKLTGKYNALDQTGDSSYRGHDSGYAFSQGKYGFYFNGNWESIGTFLMHISGSTTNGTASTTDYEVEYVEAGNGGYSNVFKFDNQVGIVDNVRIHDCYFHDTHGEGIYLGNTSGLSAQQIFRNYKFYNNRLLRTGTDGLQSVHIGDGSEIYNNVIHGAINWKSPFQQYQDNGASLDFRNGNISFRNNVIVNGPGTLFQIFVNSEPTYTGTISGTITVDNNICLYTKGEYGVYLGQSSLLSNVSMTFSRNAFGKFDFRQDEVYTTISRKSNVVQIGNDIPVSFIDNIWDGTDSKSSFYSISGGSFPSVTYSNNIISTVEDIQFEGYMGDGFNFNNFDMWASRIGDTWGNEADFPSINTKKGQSVTYSVGYYVINKSRVYECLVTNSLIEPGETLGWESYWDMKTYSNGITYSFLPSDDVRIISSNIHNSLGRGLLDNSSSSTSTTTTTTTAAATSTTTTTTTTSGATASELFISAYDYGNQYTLSFSKNSSQIQNSKIVGVGSSTLFGTGATTPNKVGEQIQTWLGTQSGKFINISLSGQSTLNCLEEGSTASVNPHRNITSAVSIRPTAILIGLPSNDIGVGLTALQFKNNILTMYNYCLNNGVPCFVISPQPRHSYTLSQQQSLSDANILIRNEIPSKFYIDVFDTLRDTGTSSPAVISATYNSGDNIHLNNAGHTVLANAIISKFNSYFSDYSPSDYTQHEIQYGSSVGGETPSSWLTLDTISDIKYVSSTYSRIDDGMYGYRMRSQLPSTNWTDWSNITYLKQLNSRDYISQTINIDFSINTNVYPPSDWNNFTASSSGPTAGASMHLLDTSTQSTGATAIVTSFFSSAGTGGPSVGIYPTRVMQDSWRVDPQQSSPSKFKIIGLDNNSAYNVDVLSSYITTDNYRYLGMWVNSQFNGSPATTSSNVANIDILGTVKGIVPINGEVEFKFYSLGSSAYLNAIVLSKYSASASTSTTTTTTTTSGPTTTTSTTTTTTTSGPTTTTSTTTTTTTSGPTTTTSTTTTTTTSIGSTSSIYLINLYGGGSTGSSNTTYNNWFVGSTITSLNTLNNIFTTTGQTSSISMSFSNLTSGGFFDNGGGYGAGLHPADVARTGIYTTNESLSISGSDINIFGLSSSLYYTLDIFASRSSSTQSSIYRIIGSSATDSNVLLVGNNTTASVSVISQPNSSGVIQIRVRKNVGTSFGHINALQISVQSSITTTSTTTTTTTLDPLATTTSTTTTTTTSPSTSTTTTTTTLDPSATTTSTTTTTTTSASSQFLTTFNSWNAYVKLPTDYNDIGNTSSYPIILFIVGLGEVGTDASDLLVSGPSKFIQSGWDGKVNVDGTIIDPIIVSLQPSSAWPIPTSVHTRIQTILNAYRVDLNRIYFTGLSMGGWALQLATVYKSTPSDYSYMDRTTAIVNVQGVKPEDSGANYASTPPYPQRFGEYAMRGGKYVGFEQSADFRDIQTIVNTMNATASGSAIFIATSYGGGGHGFFDEYYNPTKVFSALGTTGISQSIYQWMLRQL